VASILPDQAGDNGLPIPAHRQMARCVLGKL